MDTTGSSQSTLLRSIGSEISPFPTPLFAGHNSLAVIMFALSWSKLISHTLPCQSTLYLGMFMAVSLLRVLENSENIIQLLHSWSWEMLEYGFLKMCKLRFINCFKVMCLHGTGEKKPTFEHRASLLLPVSHKALMNSPIFLPVSFPAGLSEKYIFWPCLCHICKHHKWYLWKYKLILFQKHVLFLMTVHLGLSVMSLLPIMCGWEAWPCHTHRKHSCLRREGTKQSLQGKALNSLQEYLNLTLSARHLRPEFERTNPKKAQY